MPGFGVAKSPQGSAVRRLARPNVFKKCEACCEFFSDARSQARARSRGRAGAAAPIVSERNPAYCTGMTLQFVRPDIRQFCILLAAVKS
jgi:hypothetical protein